MASNTTFPCSNDIVLAAEEATLFGFNAVYVQQGVTLLLNLLICIRLYGKTLLRMLKSRKARLVEDRESKRRNDLLTLVTAVANQLSPESTPQELSESEAAILNFQRRVSANREAKAQEVSQQTSPSYPLRSVAV